MAVILAMRASSWAFCAAVTAASALAREWEVLQGKGETGTCERGVTAVPGGFPGPPPEIPTKKGDFGGAVPRDVRGVGMRGPVGCSALNRDCGDF